MNGGDATDKCNAPADDGVLLLVHGNRIFIMPYEDDERLELITLASNPQKAGADAFTLAKQGGKRFLVLRSGGRLEYRLAGGILTIVQPVARRDIWGTTTICADSKRGR